MTKDQTSGRSGEESRRDVSDVRSGRLGSLGQQSLELHSRRSVPDVSAKPARDSNLNLSTPATWKDERWTQIQLLGGPVRPLAEPLSKCHNCARRKGQNGPRQKDGVTKLRRARWLLGTSRKL